MPWAKISTSDDNVVPSENRNWHHEYDESEPAGSDFFIHAAVFFLILTVGACMMCVYKVTMDKNNKFIQKLESKVNGKTVFQKRIET